MRDFLTTLWMCLSTLIFGFIPQLSHTLALYQGPIIKNIFYKKDAYGKYISYATQGGSVASLGAQVIWFLLRVIFGGLSAEDEEKQKLGVQMQAPWGPKFNYFAFKVRK